MLRSVVTRNLDGGGPDLPPFHCRQLVSQLEVALGKVDRTQDEGVREMLTYAHERTTMAGAGRHLPCLRCCFHGRSLIVTLAHTVSISLQV